MVQLYVSRGKYSGYQVIAKNPTSYDTEGINLLLGGADLTEVDDILFNVNSDRTISNSASTMQIEVESGAIVEIAIANVVEYTFTATTLDINSGIISEIGLMQGATSTNKIDDTTSGWLFGVPTSYRFAIGGVNQVQIADGNISVEDCFIDMKEQTLPAAPAANFGRLFTRDDGSGKTQLVMRFPTGAEQVIATQP